MKLSLIIPCYNEEKNIKDFYSDCIKHLKSFEIELVFINDGSIDNTLLELKNLLCRNEARIKIINFSRNFGKEAGIYAGLKYCTGDYAVIIDADLQQPPELILDMIKKVEEDSSLDSVVYYQDVRIENKFISFIKNKFYKIIDKISDVNFVNGASDFRLINRKIIDSILKMTEFDRFSKGLFSYVGFNVEYLPYTPRERRHGTSKWNFKSLVEYAFSGIISFSKFPLILPIYVGCFLNVVSILYFVVILILKILNYNIGLLYLIIGLVTFFSSLNFIFMGIIGQYLSRTYNEVRKRPIYIVKDLYENNKKQ